MRFSSFNIWISKYASYATFQSFIITFIINVPYHPNIQIKWFPIAMTHFDNLNYEWKSKVECISQSTHMLYIFHAIRLERGHALTAFSLLFFIEHFFRSNNYSYQMCVLFFEHTIMFEWNSLSLTQNRLFCTEMSIKENTWLNQLNEKKYKIKI